ncbi:ATP-binding protein [Geothermobacter hydrogeniphilus]|uniref:AAA family ATPase n=1 Tax=Geothermobacter hydrogeniphilus TaxID=1969733 RepID=A0A1X0XPI7_9BACT|nr:ATP-binding protein [Geothermobacter hydrogeniphilus]ORJ54773.1 AAA family ATPase [Geothermobacter hydrogeniphilus]
MDQDLKEQLQRVLSAVEQILPKPVPPIDWQRTYAANWRRHSLAGYLEARDALDPIQLDHLLGIETEKRIVEENTQQFLAGMPANNILLWGTRGTGKSSLIRAILNAYADQGLRIIQIDKDDLLSLPDIFQQIRDLPYRFIIFCDDLSFEPGEKTYKMLKSALDGSVYAAPDNVLIYVTSNRRHLLPEYETDNLGAKMVNNEIHHGEGVEEKISLSDRFGLWVAFHAFSQDHYLTVVRQCIALQAAHHQVDIEWTAETENAAIAWSHEKSKRCGRTAYQFSKYWVGRQMLARQRTRPAANAD